MRVVHIPEGEIPAADLGLNKFGVVTGPKESQFFGRIVRGVSPDWLACLDAYQLYSTSGITVKILPKGTLIEI